MLRLNKKEEENEASKSAEEETMEPECVSSKK